ncbi:hypothetical protein FZEAL_3765 [Fusarium zealandicum]|uniref:LITAF domain-containing protein n=1 Tax=Fusarium zealandicum TaxID=1053134 RepID=A0A8H4UNI9_9HYPO|nr:hypothetical protein FZEAL_3765 [Fusarium zealandicum]
MSTQQTQVPWGPDSASPPSYTPAQGLDDKIPYDSSLPASGPQRAKTLRTYINDGGLPEVVTTDQMAKETGYFDGLIPVVTPETPAPQGYFDDDTVTPLHLLGDQPDTVDCPFCRHRVMTKIKKSPSIRTHLTATALGLTTIGGAVAPYACGWNSHLNHHCTYCNRKVACRRDGQKEMKPLGTPRHLREASRQEVHTQVQLGLEEPERNRRIESVISPADIDPGPTPGTGRSTRRVSTPDEMALKLDMQQVPWRDSGAEYD